MNSPIVVDPHTGLSHRSDTCDLQVIKEMRTYRALDLRPTDILFDVGGNIGAFSATFARKCAKVVAYEPDYDNFQLLLTNTMYISNVVAVRAALTKHYNSVVKFFLNNTGRNKGLHSQFVSGGRDCVEVPALNFNNELARHQPTVIKMDTEGAEYDLLLDNPLPSHVREIILEIHLQKKEWRGEKANRLIAQLEAQFPVIVQKAVNSPKSRAILGHYRRET